MKKRETVAEQEPILASLVHHLAHYRTLNELADKNGSLYPFWACTQNAHLLLTVVDWCMIFGSCGTDGEPNLAHWKHVVEEKETRNTIACRTGMPRGQWSKYWHAMVSYRNQYAAHRDPRRRWPAPACFDHALDLAFAYDEWLDENGLRTGTSSHRTLYDELRGTDLDMVADAYLALGRWFQGDDTECIGTTTTTTTTTA
jgi:hypothetical protein